MKKTLLAVISALVMILGLSACGNNNNAERAQSGSLYTQGLEVIQLLSEMAQTSEYVDMFGSDDIKSIVQRIGTGDFSKPEAVYAITVTDNKLLVMAGFDSLNKVSDSFKSFLKHRMLGAIITQINSMSGAANLAAASVCTAGKTFVNKDTAEDVIYLYTYENAVPVAVTFTVGEDHAVSASGTFIINDGFLCSSADEIKSFFFFRGIDVEVTRVFPEK